MVIRLPPAGRPKDYLRIGRSFVEAAWRCFTDQQQLQCDEPILMYIPICVNASFACELLLKGMVHLEGKTVPKTHNLLKLYNLLSDHNKYFLYGVYVDKEHDKEEAKRRYEALLSKYSSEFNRTRYSVETPSKASFDVTALLSMCYNMLIAVEVAFREQQKAEDQS